MGKPTKQAGFTITEVIVVIVVFGIGLYMLTELSTSVQKSQREAFYIGVAMRAARSEIERIRSSEYDTVADNDEFTARLPETLPPGSTGVVDVSVPTNAPDSKQINATVSYPIGTIFKRVTVSAYVDEPGDNEI